MKNAIYILFLLAGILFPGVCLSDEPNISYAKEMPKISDDAKYALASLLTSANVPGCEITSTARTSAQQARIMYNYITKYGVDKARKLYGSEGNEVVDVYVAETIANTDKKTIMADMEAKIKEVLPEAIKHNHLMHVDRPDYDVFDVSTNSIPGDKRDAFLAAAKASTLFYRVLGPGEGEQDCYHFEFKKLH